MHEPENQQHDIARTLHLLLPVHGAPKTLRELRDQVRLLNEISDPDDERFTRVIASYLQDSYFKIDRDLNFGDPSARWTCVRTGPSISEPVGGGRGERPDRKQVKKKLPAIAAGFSSSDQGSIYLWDLLKIHFGVTRDNNSYYRQWLETLSDILKSDPRFVMVAVDSETSIPVEWMLAVDRARQVREAVNQKLPQIIAFTQQDRRLVHLTRSLVHHFFSPQMTDETYDMHAYYKVVSETLAENPLVIEVSVQEKARQATAWIARERVHSFIQEQIDRLVSWLYSTEGPQTITRISHECFRSLTDLVSVAPLENELTRLLQEDIHFLFDEMARSWQTIPPGDPRNDAAYHVLRQQWHPLPSQVLTERAQERFPELSVDFDLGSDHRFSRWRSGGWGLRQWVDINDLAYEYLREEGTELALDQVVAGVCDNYDIDLRLAIFFPEGDPRFSQRVDGKWVCQYTITDDDLEQMLEMLCSAGEGFTLDDLVFWSIGIEAGGTDVAARLAWDDRFLLVDGLWFARKEYYRLSDEDVEELLAVLQLEKTGLRSATLIRRVLNREVSSTDAETKLRADSRFEELLPSVWASRDLEFRPEERKPIVNLRIQSDKVPVVSDEELTVLEELTLRESQSCGAPETVPRRQVRRTLSYLDVEYGNLTIDQGIATLMDTNSTEVVHFTDEIGNEFTCWVDGERNLLQGMGSWFRERNLTYGDRIVLTPTSESDFLEVRPVGERDNRVYQEAMQRRDVDQLIESGQRTGKSYHDLMIEVMDHLNDLAGEPVPLHRESIYNLVNYNRTASRSHIFALLSLSDCPYEELRYFVRHGRGYWSFDRERKKAFDMKMKELVGRVEELEDVNERLRVDAGAARTAQGRDAAKVVKLGKQLQEQAVQMANLSARNDDLLQANQDLTDLSTAQRSQIQDLDVHMSTLEAQVAELIAEMEGLRSDRDSLQRDRDNIAEIRETQSCRIEELLRDKADLESEIARLNTELHQATLRYSALHERAEKLETHVSELAGDNQVLRQEHQQLRARLDEIDVLRESNAALQRDIADLQVQRAELLQARETQKSRTVELNDVASRMQKEVSTLQADLSNLSSQNADLEEQIHSLRTEKEHHQKEYEQNLDALQAEISTRQLEREDLIHRADAEQRRLHAALGAERTRVRELQERLDGLERLHRRKDSEIVQLTAKVERISAVMSTRSGRVLVSISRLFGGPDLSDL